MRIFAVNPHGFGLKDKEKINNLREEAKTNSIDHLLFSSIDRMQNATNKSKIKRKLQSIDQNIEINTANSGRYEEVKNQFIPGRIMSVIFGYQTNLIKIENNFADPKGRQSAIMMEANKKRILIVVLYRIPDSSNQRNYTVKAQIDKVGKEVKMAKKHREEMLKDLTIYITNQQAEVVILASNMNENVYS